MKVSMSQWQKGCDQGCNIHFQCDCGKFITACQDGKSVFPEGHGEDWGECAYLQGIKKTVPSVEVNNMDNTMGDRQAFHIEDPVPEQIQKSKDIARAISAQDSCPHPLTGGTVKVTPTDAVIVAGAIIFGLTRVALAIMESARYIASEMEAQVDRLQDKEV